LARDLLVVDDLSTGVLANLSGLDVEVARFSVLDQERLDRAVAGADAIVHLAALPSVPRSMKEPIAVHQANATGTLAVLAAAHHHDVGHVVVASSSSVYGANPALPKRETDWTAPRSPYAASKQSAEAYALAYQAGFDLATMVFRFFNVYGPGQRADHPYAAVIPRFIEAALAGRPLELHGDGRQSRDFTFVDSVCDVLIDTVRRRVSHPGPVNLAFGASTELLAVVEALSAILGRDLPLRFSATRDGDVRHSRADPALLRQLFPQAEAIRLADGLARTVDWFAASVGEDTGAVARLVPAGVGEPSNAGVTLP
jgi:UDP-glucose 4-epimerase